MIPGIILRGKDPALGIARDAVEGEEFTTMMDYNPSGTWATNTSYSGSFRVIGDNLESRVIVTTTGSPESTVFRLNIPSDYQIDTSKLSTGTRIPVGSATLFNGSSTGAPTYMATAVWVSTAPTQVTIVHHLVSGSLVTLPATGVTEMVPFTWGSGDGMDVYYSIPVSKA
jgi:hypothetical protein